jgi:azurin
MRECHLSFNESSIMHTKNQLVSQWSGIACLSALLLLTAACGGGDAPDASAVEPPVTEITITGDDRMRFAPTRFTVRAGETITLTLDNIGRMPKESMGHNLAILDRGVNVNAFAAAAVGYANNRYIPSAYADRVIAATNVLGPGEKEVITFAAPSAAGEYPFVCSFPGHTQAGMRGIMTVVH